MDSEALRVCKKSLLVFETQVNCALSGFSISAITFRSYSM